MIRLDDGICYITTVKMLTQKLYIIYSINKLGDHY